MQRLKLKSENQTLTASLLCEIDHHTAGAIREEIDGKILAGGVKVLVLDFSRVPFMDSSGIGLIMGRAARAGEIGAKVEVRGLMPKMKKIVALSGISKLENLVISD